MRYLMQQGALALVSIWVLAQPAAAQRVGGQSFGAYVNAFGVSTTLGRTVLPDTGGFGAADVDNASASGVGVDMLSSLTSGAVDNRRSSSQSTSHLENVNLLSGLITARTVIAAASSAISWTGASSNALGSSFTDLVVAGQSFGGDFTPAPNTRVSLPGVGYAILNEQVRSGDGVTATGMTVNMIHVVQTNFLGVKTGEIILGSARSFVTR